MRHNPRMADHRAHLLALMLGAALAFGGGASAQEAAPDPGAKVAEGQEADEAAVVPEDVDDAEDAQDREDLSTTGDAWLDAQLADISRYGARYRDAFTDEVVRYREAPRALVEALLGEGGWEPGDVYFACSLAAVTGRSCRYVADRRGQPAVAGWEALASELGAGPGSEAFGRIRQGVVHSYRRWARPLELDAGLARAFPDHGKAPSPRTGDGD